MEDYDKHPQNAYELGRVAVARLREQNEELSEELPNALEGLFSDKEFREAIVTSGITNKAQSLTPVASYQVTGNYSGRITRATSSKRGINQAYVMDEESNSSEASSPVRKSPRNVRVGRKKVEKVVGVEIEDEEGREIVGRVESTTNTNVELESTLKVKYLEVRLIAVDDLPDESQSISKIVTVGEEVEEVAAAVASISEGPEIVIEQDSPSTQCLTCRNSTTNTLELSEEGVQKRRKLRDVFWLSMGMTKYYDRTLPTFPFCEACAEKAQKLLDICKRIGKLEDEFEVIRQSFCVGLVSNHFDMTQAVKDAKSKNDVKKKVLRRMKASYENVLPGNKLLTQISVLSSNRADGSEVNFQESEDTDGSEDEFFVECQFCDKTFLSTHAKIIHERKAHIKQVESESNQSKTFLCKICAKSFSTRKGLENHESSHENEKRKFKCQYCDKSFVNNANLQDHIIRHKGFKPLRCTICSERHYKMRHMSAHFIKRHPGKNPAKLIEKLTLPDVEGDSSVASVPVTEGAEA